MCASFIGARAGQLHLQATNAFFWPNTHTILFFRASRRSQPKACTQCAENEACHAVTVAPIAGSDESRWTKRMRRPKDATAWPWVVICSTHLLSRQQIHSADGDELGDGCTATIFPGCMWLCCCRRRMPGCRWSLMNEPPPRPSASHDYRLLSPPSSCHAEARTSDCSCMQTAQTPRGEILSLELLSSLSMPEIIINAFWHIRTVWYNLNHPFLDQ